MISITMKIIEGIKFAFGTNKCHDSIGRLLNLIYTDLWIHPMQIILDNETSKQIDLV